MARTATATIKADMDGVYNNTQTTAGETGERAFAPFGDKNTVTFATGSGANQIDRAWASESRVVSGDSPVDFFNFTGEDIGSGSGNDMVGNALELAGVKSIYVKNLSSSTDDLRISGGNTAWTGFFGSVASEIALPPGTVFVITNPTAAGWDVTETSNESFGISSTAGSVCDIALVGIST